MVLNKESSLLITGGTGSFGKSFLSRILKKFPPIKRVVIFSRDELKQWELQQQFPQSKFPNLRFFIGDIRDKDRLSRALEGIDIVIHAAALKQVPAAEYNPIEFIRTNVIGAENLVDASLNLGIKRIIALSTDKAASPINLYGATKLCSDKLFIAANNIRGKKESIFSVVRYGNVMGSRGSVIPFFIEKSNSRILPITDSEMTRFNISLDESIDMVLWALENAEGGEIFVPKIPSYKILDLAEAIGPSCKKEFIGIRAGEKIHEEMITPSDSPLTIDLGKYYSIMPNIISFKNKLSKNKSYKPVEKNFHYHSGNNKDILSVEDIRKLIRKNIDENFVPI